MHTVVQSTMWLTFVLHLLVALGGYLRFGDAVSANILDSLPNGYAVGAARLSIVLAFAFTFPMMIFLCRMHLHSILARAHYVDPQSDKRKRRACPVQSCPPPQRLIHAPPRLTPSHHTPLCPPIPPHRHAVRAPHIAITSRAPTRRSRSTTRHATPAATHFAPCLPLSAGRRQYAGSRAAPALTPALLPRCSGRGRDFPNGGAPYAPLRLTSGRLPGLCRPLPKH